MATSALLVHPNPSLARTRRLPIEINDRGAVLVPAVRPAEPALKEEA
jgi:hypothetical protein